MRHPLSDIQGKGGGNDRLGTNLDLSRRPRTGPQEKTWNEDTDKRGWLSQVRTRGFPKLGEMGRRKERNRMGISGGKLTRLGKKFANVEGPPRHDFLPTLYGWLQSFPVIPFEL